MVLVIRWHQHGNTGKDNIVFFTGQTEAECLRNWRNSKFRNTCFDYSYYTETPPEGKEGVMIYEYKSH